MVRFSYFQRPTDESKYRWEARSAGAVIITLGIFVLINLTENIYFVIVHGEMPSYVRAGSQIFVRCHLPIGDKSEKILPLLFR